MGFKEFLIRENKRIMLEYPMLHPDYNWKQHSTGFLLKMKNNLSFGYRENGVLEEALKRVKDELAKRPHLPNKKEGKALRREKAKHRKRKGRI